MFERLKNKWKVGGLQLALILIVFALGGSLCGYAGRKFLDLFDIDEPALRVALYIILITLLWPVSVMLISIPFGQFAFFRNYLRKVFRWFAGKSLKK